MPTDREIKQLVQTVSKKLAADQNRPYRIRRKKAGTKNSRGNTNTTADYDYRTINNMRTQPLSDEELNRLPEGLRGETWRFVQVVPEIPGRLPSSQDEFLDFGDQVEYKGHWYEVKMINDWDLIQGCKAVFAE